MLRPHEATDGLQDCYKFINQLINMVEARPVEMVDDENEEGEEDEKEPESVEEKEERASGCQLSPSIKSIGGTMLEV